MKPFKTLVPQSIKDALTSRPDWPEIDRRMKSVYGDKWELVSYEEAVQSCKPEED